MSPSRSDLQLELGVHPNDWHGGFKGEAAEWSSQRQRSVQHSGS